MAKHGGGSIINTASVAGLRSGHGFPMYRAAKAGVIHFSKSAAIELGEHLIRVIAFVLGIFRPTWELLQHLKQE